MSDILTLRAKPIEYPAIQWKKNEPFVRSFVGNDTKLRFPAEGKLEIWNDLSNCWMNVPLFHYVAVGLSGELFPLSNDAVHAGYDIVKTLEH